MQFVALANDIVETAYEAVVDDSAFSRLVELLDGANPAGFTAFHCVATNTDIPAISYCDGMDPAALQDYMDEYRWDDPGRKLIAKLDRGASGCMLDVISEEKYKNSRYYHEFALRLNDIRNFRAIGLSQDAKSQSILSVNIAARDFDNLDPFFERLLALVQPHLKRAVALRQRRLAVEVDRLAHLVHALSVPALLIAPDGAITAVNGPAQRLLWPAPRAGSDTPAGTIAAFAKTIAHGARAAGFAEIATRQGPVSAHACRIGPERGSGLVAAFAPDAGPAVLVTLTAPIPAGDGAPQTPPAA